MKERINIKDCVGKKILAYQYTWSYSPIELKVIKLSPSGEYVKVCFENGYGEWIKVDDPRIVDILAE